MGVFITERIGHHTRSLKVYLPAQIVSCPFKRNTGYFNFYRLHVSSLSVVVSSNGNYITNQYPMISIYTTFQYDPHTRRKKTCCHMNISAPFIIISIIY